ncbi:hypothetical protein RJ639_016082 [Escallonia herrerae]|uniref:Uncharacterized protein n=1 Tax=Escallonia herrerae TaxID=1293975 RepID=A0AA89AN28_9ASTE|nr:hypothetical protein RJ639_016082 [Escallonia herrerae]
MDHFSAILRACLDRLAPTLCSASGSSRTPLSPSPSLGAPPISAICIHWSKCFDAIQDVPVFDGLDFFAAGVGSLYARQLREDSCRSLLGPKRFGGGISTESGRNMEVVEVGQWEEELMTAEKMAEVAIRVLCAGMSVAVSSLIEFAAGSAEGYAGDVKDQAEDKANPKPCYTEDEKSNKMSIKDLLELIREYPLPEGWYARLPGLQEPANYGTKFKTGIYEEQMKSGYRLPLYPFAICFFDHYCMAPGQLVPNGWRKLVGLIHLVQTSGYEPDATDFMSVFQNLFRQRSRQLLGMKWLAKVGKSTQGGFLDVLQKAKGKRKEKQSSIELPPIPKKTRVTPPDHSPHIVETVSIDEDPIFIPRWTLMWDDIGIPDSQISEQHLVHRVLPRDKEVFQNQTHETFACSFAQAVYTMYASGSTMLSLFEIVRQVAAEVAQQKRDAIKEAEEATCRAEELSKQEADYLAQIETLEKILKRAKRKVAEEVTKARDQGIRDFLDRNAGEEWLKKKMDDGLEIYDMGFMKAKEIFAEHFSDIPLDDFVMPAVVSPSGETAMPSEAGDAAASHPPVEGPSGDAPSLRFCCCI